jgi:spore coat protein A, manganese oxidase
LCTGLAGFYVTDDSASATGGCGGPMKLDTVEQRHLMFADKVLDRDCQLLFDVRKGGYHEASLFGDINTVSGQAWPVMKLEPKWYRFRLLNAGPSRPYKVRRFVSSCHSCSCIR